MSVVNPPLGLQNAGATHTASMLRMALAGLQAGTFSTATTLRSRGGIHPGMGQELVVTQAGSPNMTVLVEPGVASIPGTESGTQGNYFVINDAQVTLSVTAAHATLARIDLVVFNVRDQFYSGAFNDSQLQVIAGTPSGSPVAPAAPANSIILAQVAVAAAAVSIVNANITDTRFYIAGVGGVINVRTDAARPTSVEIVEGQLVWVMAINTLYIWDGANYINLYPGDWTTWVPTLTNITTTGGTTTARQRLLGKTLDFRLKFKLGVGSAIGTSPRFTISAAMHASYVTLEEIPLSSVMLYDAGTANFLGTLRIINSTTFEVMAQNASTAITSEASVTATVPFTWTTGDVLSCHGRVELA